MADGTSSLSSVVNAWELAVEDVRRASENHLQARSEERRADCVLSNAIEAEKKAFAALLALRPEMKR